MHCWKHNFDTDLYHQIYILRAARYSHLSVVEKLLELGANPNATNKFGMVPLHHAAVAGGSPEVIVALIKAGADVSNIRRVAKGDPGSYNFRIKKSKCVFNKRIIKVCVSCY